MLMAIVGQFDQIQKTFKTTNTDVYFRGNSITCKGEKEKLKYLAKFKIFNKQILFNQYNWKRRYVLSVKIK